MTVNGSGHRRLHADIASSPKKEQRPFFVSVGWNWPYIEIGHQQWIIAHSPGKEADDRPRCSGGAPPHIRSELSDFRRRQVLLPDMDTVGI